LGVWSDKGIPKYRKKQYVKSWNEVPEKFRMRMVRRLERDGHSINELRALIDAETGIEYIIRPKVKWVNNWKEVPSEKKEMKKNKVRPSEIGGVYIPDKHKIIAVRGKATPAHLLHEEGHSRQKSAGTSNPRVHTYNEISADMFSYKQIGKPKHNRAHLNFTWLELVDRYKVQDNTALQYILDALRKAHAPKEWFDDFDKLVKEVNSWKKQYREEQKKKKKKASK
jgi:hypothetical protein